jgi:chromosomal replication initiator protein
MMHAPMPSADLPMAYLRLRGTATLIQTLIQAASHHTGISADAITSPCRKQELARTRFAIMRVAHESGKPFAAIGRSFGRRDSSTIVHGVARARKLEAASAPFAELVNALRLACVDACVDTRVVVVVG